MIDELCPLSKVVLDHPEVADKLLKSNAKVPFNIIGSSLLAKLNNLLCLEVTSLIYWSSNDQVITNSLIFYQLLTSMQQMLPFPTNRNVFLWLNICHLQKHEHQMKHLETFAICRSTNTRWLNILTLTKHLQKQEHHMTKHFDID